MTSRNRSALTPDDLRSLNRSLSRRKRLRTIRVGAYDRNVLEPLSSYTAQLKRIQQIDRLLCAFARSLDHHGSSALERAYLKRVVRLIEDILS